MRKILMILGLGLALLPAMAHAQHAHRPASDPVTWSRCVVHLDWATMSHVNKRTCSTYAIRKAHAKPVGVRKEVTQKSPHVRIIVRYPTFPAPAPAIAAIMYVPVTGYAWGCGTPFGQTASGKIPQVGYVATGGTNDWIPFGAAVYVPSLGYHGIVEDRGQGEGGFDLFSPSCDYADSVIGNSTREVIVYG